MSTNKAFVVKNGLSVGPVTVIDPQGQIDFTQLKNKPTTLAGYGITDGGGASGSFTTNITQTGTGLRYLADFSNATHASRVLFQTSTLNGNTSIGSMPNGTGADGRFTAYAVSDPNNSVTMVMGSDSTSGYIASEQRGTATYKPLNMWTAGSLAMSLATDGTVKAARGEVQAELRSNGGQFRALYGTNPAFFIRNDGASTYFMLTNNNDPQGTWNSLRPLSIHNASGQLTSQTGFIQNRGFGVVNFQTIGDIGGAFADWNGTRWPALQVDAPAAASAYMIWRATRWGGRHIACMDAYEGGSATSTCMVGMSVGNTQNAFIFDAGGNFTAAGNVAAFSDERLKTNWRDVESGMVEKLAEVKSGIYERIDTGETQVGVSAQSIQKILPNAVTEDSTSGNLKLAYGNAAMVAIVEMAKEMKAMKAEIAELKAALVERG